MTATPALSPDSQTTIHRFEAAGLGKAPFRFIGIEREPIGSCAYCGEGITECCIIRSADGRTFIVGNVCVGKVGDVGLRKVAAAAIRQHRTEATHARQDAKIAEAKAALTIPEVRNKLASEPHPTDFMAAQGVTRLKWAEWMLKNAGRRGRLDVAAYLKVLGFETLDVERRAL